MSGTALSKFADFIASTGPAYLTGPDVLVNEAVERNYLWGELARGRTGANVQSGTEIKDALMLDASNTFEFYKPNATFSYRNPQVIDSVSAPWRFAVDHMAFTDHEIELNAGEGLSRDGLKTVYKRLKRQKEQRMVTSLINGMEASLFADPVADQAEIEGATGSKPFPLSVLINEIITSSANTQLGEVRGGGKPKGYSSIMGIDPFDEPRWTNQVAFYDKSNLPSTSQVAVTPTNATNIVTDDDSVDDADGNTEVPVGGLLNCFDDMFLKCEYTAPAQFSEYFDNASMRSQIIACSREGLNQYTDQLRNENDRLVSPQDPAYAQPSYAGIPLRYISKLDTAAMYPKDDYAGSTSSATEAAAERPGARYHFINAEYLSCVLHGRHFFKKSDVMRHPNQPYTSIVLCDTWWNLMARSRQRHGIIAPV